MTTNTMNNGLYDFLALAELQHYHTGFVDKLKVNNVAQLKYVEDEDMASIGMSKPEVRRMKQFIKKETSKGALSRIRKILTKSDHPTHHPPSISISPPILDHSSSLPGNNHINLIPNTSLQHSIKEEAIVLSKVLGKGEFASVQQGIWTKDNGEQVSVAVKCLPLQNIQSSTSEFLHEANIMHNLQHENIVRLFGVVQTSDKIMLATELAPLKSLLECLKTPSLRPIFPVKSFFTIALQVAEGMAYLERNRLIHRDLAARNVLVFDRDKVKVSDFGLSKALGIGSDYYQAHLNTGLKLSIAWCAPECINYLRFTSASDVWSYGVFLWEMFNYGEQPWQGLTGLEIMQRVDAPKFERLPAPEKCPSDWYSIMLECWKPEANERPKFSHLSSLITQLKPSLVSMQANTMEKEEGFLKCKMNDLVLVLNKEPSKAPKPHMWLGLLDATGEVGFIDPSNTTPYHHVNPSHNILRKIKINRTESARMSIRNQYKAIPDLISRPHNDLRHIGHVGYDGAVFGDVAFIANDYDKLPLKTSCAARSEDDLRASLPIMKEHSKHYSLSRSTLPGHFTLPEPDEFDDFALPEFSSEGETLIDEVLTALNFKNPDDTAMKNLLAGFSISNMSSSNGISNTNVNGHQLKNTVNSNGTDDKTKDADHNNYNDFDNYINKYNSNDSQTSSDTLSRNSLSSLIDSCNVIENNTTSNVANNAESNGVKTTMNGKHSIDETQLDNLPFMVKSNDYAVPYKTPSQTINNNTNDVNKSYHLEKNSTNNTEGYTTSHLNQYNGLLRSGINGDSSLKTKSLTKILKEDEIEHPYDNNYRNSSYLNSNDASQTKSTESTANKINLDRINLVAENFNSIRSSNSSSSHKSNSHTSSNGFRPTKNSNNHLTFSSIVPTASQEDMNVGEDEEESPFDSSSTSSTKESTSYYIEDKKSSQTSPTERPLGHPPPVPSKPSCRQDFKASISTPRAIDASSLQRTSKTFADSSDKSSFQAPNNATTTSSITLLNSYKSRSGSLTAQRSSLRAPIIPGRSIPSSDASDDSGAMDTNPLRRLRQSAGTRPMMTFRPTRTEDHHAFSANPTFFDKLKEQQN